MNFGLPQRGENTSETVEYLFGHVAKISKELDFILKNLDTDNFSPEVITIIQEAAGKAGTLYILLRDIAFYENGVIASYADGSTAKWTWTKDVDGRITLFHNVTDNFDVNVTWNAGDMP